MKIKYVFEMGDDREVVYYNNLLKGFTEYKKLSNDKVRTAKWEVISDDETEIINFSPLVCRTNDNGEGIFSEDMMKQITGTCQFSVYGLTKSSARRKIRNLYT